MPHGPVLVVGTDLNLIHDVTDRLLQHGVEAQPLVDPGLVASRCLVQLPGLVLAESRALGLEISRRLAAFAETAQVPIAFLLGGPRSELERLKAFWAGAVDVFPLPFGAFEAGQVGALLQDLSLRPPATQAGRGPGVERAVESLLRHCRRLVRSGALILNPGTPFQGRAAFVDGKLSWAEYGPLTGLAALEEMLWCEDGTWHFENASPGPGSAAVARAVSPVPEVPEVPDAGADRPRRRAPYAPSVLVVDDDPELLPLLVCKLEDAGLAARGAGDGQAGLDSARADPPDLVLTDLDMPVLDGWGLLQALAVDHRTRAVPVAVLSARDDWRDTLQATRAGAIEYIPKTWRLEALCARALELTAARRDADERLRLGEPLRLETRELAPSWVLRRVAALGLSGVLTLEDAWGEYSVWLRDGAPIQARSVTRRREVRGAGALADLLVTRQATGWFQPGEVSGADAIGTPLPALLSRICATLNRLEERALDARLTDASSFMIDEVLYDLYRHVASDPALRMARAVCEDGLRPAEVAERFALPPEQVHEGLKELLRRGVIRLLPADRQT